MPNNSEVVRLQDENTNLKDQLHEMFLKCSALQKKCEELEKEKQLWSHTAQFRRVELMQKKCEEMEDELEVARDANAMQRKELSRLRSIGVGDIEKCFYRRLELIDLLVVNNGEKYTENLISIIARSIHALYNGEE